MNATPDVDLLLMRNQCSLSSGSLFCEFTHCDLASGLPGRRWSRTGYPKTRKLETRDRNRYNETFPRAAGHVPCRRIIFISDDLRNLQIALAAVLERNLLSHGRTHKEGEKY